MKNNRLLTYSSRQRIKPKSNYQPSQQAIQGLSNTLILTIGLAIAMLLSVSHIYLLILIQVT